MVIENIEENKSVINKNVTTNQVLVKVGQLKGRRSRRVAIADRF